MEVLFVLGADADEKYILYAIIFPSLIIYIRYNNILNPRWFALLRSKMNIYGFNSLSVRKIEYEKQKRKII